MLNTPNSTIETIEDTITALQKEGWIIDDENEESDSGEELNSGDMIGIINIVDGEGKIQEVLYKKLVSRDGVIASTDRVKRTYYICTGKGLIRWGTPNKEKPPVRN